MVNTPSSSPATVGGFSWCQEGDAWFASLADGGFMGLSVEDDVVLWEVSSDGLSVDSRGVKKTFEAAALAAIKANAGGTVNVYPWSP